MPPPRRETPVTRFSTCTGTNSLLKEPGFESGVGFGALYMLVSNQQEFQRLNNLLEQTETLVQQMKRHIQHHGRKIKSSSCSKILNTCPIEIKPVAEQGLLHYNDQNELLQECSHMKNTLGGGCQLEDHNSVRIFRRNTLDGVCHQEDQDYMRKGKGTTLDGCQKEDQDFTGKAMVTEEMVKNCEMSALEVELEAELELLEFNLNIKESCPEQEAVYESGEGDSKEATDILHNDRISYSMHDTSDPGRRGRQSTNLGALSVDYAVSPFELDRRLREVLEAQQKERILELEELLRETKTLLHAKEEEIHYWKNCVHDLTKSFQPSSADGTDMRSSDNVSSDSMRAHYLHNMPEFTKTSLEVLGTFQDPPISSQINHVENVKSPFSFAGAANPRNHPSSSAIDVNMEEMKLPLSVSEISDALSFEESVELVKIVTESHTSWHIQGSGVVTSETTDRSMGEIEVHTPVPMIPNSFRGQSVSRASERSDYFQQDDLNSVTSPSCWDFCEEGDSSVANSNNTCSHHTRDISSFCSRSSSSKDMPCIEQNGYVKTKEISDVQVHPCLESLKRVSKVSRSRYQVMEDLSSGCNDSKGMAVEERNSSDVKETVDLFMPDLHFNTLKRRYSKTQSPLNVAAKAPRGRSKMKNEDLQIVTTGLRRSFNAEESSIGVTSPVLGKIRHWEALGRGLS